MPKRSENWSGFRDDSIKELTASALILTLLSVAPRQTIPVQVLIEAGRLFGLTERSIRVALNRLDADAKVHKLARGLYGFTLQAEGVQREVANWTAVQDRVIEWRGAWIAVYGGKVSRTDRKQLRRHESALRLRGFRPLTSDLWVRPENLKGGVKAVEADLRAFGLSENAIVFVASDFSGNGDPAKIDLWSSSDLERRYSKLIAELQRSEGRLARLPVEDALVETLSIGRRVIRTILLDPLLPNALSPDAGRTRLINQMKRYDLLGQRLWHSFLERHIAGHAGTVAGAR
jgi:phenylacetic acid degradation operon negative regulatory protein